MEKQVYELKVDPELEAFLTPLTEQEENALEKNIIENGCRTPLVIWNGTIVDGHHRYRICRKNNIPFAVEEQSFADKNEAMLWMYQEQKSHRNMGTVARVVMALKCKPILLQRGKQNQGHRSDLDILFNVTKSHHNTRKMIAEMADTSESNVSRIEKIWEAADEKTKTALLEEKTTPNKVYQSLFPKTENQKTGTDQQASVTTSTSDDTDLSAFSDDELELELFKRRFGYDTEWAKRRMEKTIAPAEIRDYIDIPVWEYGVDEAYNAIANGFYRNLWRLIDSTDKKFLTDNTMVRLLDRIDELFDQASERINEAMKDKFGGDYCLPGFDDE